MGKIIVFANQKGGVGKSTSVYNVGASLAAMGHRTLMIDLDPQATLTIMVGLEPFETEKTIAAALADKGSPLQECILSLREKLDIAPSRLELMEVEANMGGRVGGDLVLKGALSPIRGDYDFILLDCPPYLGKMTVNALAACDEVIVPVKTDYPAYRGLELIVGTIRDVRKVLNPDLKMAGVLATLYDQRVKNDNDILEALREETEVIGVVRSLVDAHKGIYSGLAARDRDPKSPVAIAYDEVAALLIAREGLA